MSIKKKYSEYLNNREYGNWFTKLYNIILASIEWENVPDSIDPRFIEQTLFWQGRAVWFKDDILGDLCLPVINTSVFDWYGNLISCRGRSYNYTSDYLNCGPWNINGEPQEQNAVIIYNNVARLPDLEIILAYAERLSNIDRTIDVNVAAQKTPVLIRCEESERFTLRSVYNDYKGNEPVIFGSKNINPNAITSISTKADFVSQDLFALRKQLLQDCLAYMGIESNVSEKAERVIAGEITANMGQIESYRQTRIYPRQQAVDVINRIFGHNIKVRFRSELSLSKIMEGGASNNVEELYSPAQAGNATI